MKEIVFKNRKNGMMVLLLTVLLYLAALGGCIWSGVLMEQGVNTVVWLVISIVWLCLGWIPAMGLKVLGPQEALVLTLFGKYIGTLREEGFYFVNPFCSAVNPAAATRLKQSGDVGGIRKSLQGCGGSQPENFAEGHDAEQRPAED